MSKKWWQEPKYVGNLILILLAGMCLTLTAVLLAQKRALENNGTYKAIGAVCSDRVCYSDTDNTLHCFMLNRKYNLTILLKKTALSDYIIVVLPGKPCEE